jgi:hypothetical protein
LKIRKINKTRVFVGSFAVLVPLDNTFSVAAHLFVKQGNEYRKLPYRSPKKPLCEFYQSDIFFMQDFCEKSNLTYPVPCPIEAGTYSMNGYAPSLKNVPVSIISTGEYALDVIVTKGEQTLWIGRFMYSCINL